MNKAFYIVGIVFSVIFMMVRAYYAEEVSFAKWNSYFAASFPVIVITGTITLTTIRRMMI